MRAPSWLTAAPIAHRGLHDRTRGLIENMSSAVSAAIDGGFGIEVDLQLSADGEAMVHHDHQLGRLEDATGELRQFSAAQLRQIAFRETADRMMSLGELCDLVACRATLVLEIKSDFADDDTLVRRVVDVVRSYRGPVAAMSFDPDQVAALRALAPSLVRGIVAQRRYDDSYWSAVPPAKRTRMLHLRHGFRTQPHFVAYWVDQLPAAAPWIARNLFGCPLLTWTVRTTKQRATAQHDADQMIFEGFRPDQPQDAAIPA